MTYNDIDDIYEKAAKAIKENNLYFIEDIVAYIPIAKSTFYDYYPIGSDKSNELKELLNQNRIEGKVKMRKNWMDSENATLQMGLYKLIASTDERKRLSQTYQDHTTNGKELSTLTAEEREARIQALKDKMNESN